MESMLVSKNVTINGHRTSLRLEGDTWDALGEICHREGYSIHDLCSSIERNRKGNNRTSEIRTFVLNYYRSASTRSGHAKAGHGRLKGYSRAAVRSRLIESQMSLRSHKNSVIGHSLRTPLNTIIGFSEMIKDEIFGPIGNPRYQAYIDYIHGSGRHLLNVIENGVKIDAMSLFSSHSTQ